MKKRDILFLLFNLAAFAIFSRHLAHLFTISLNNGLYSHIILIPAVSGYLIYSNRKNILSQTECGIFTGIPVIILSLAVYGAGAFQQADGDARLSAVTLSALLFWAGGFAIFYGARALKNASFPLLFLIFMVPVPGLIMDNVINLLQRGSTEAAYMILKSAGVPFIREGFIFHMGGMDIEVARECSGIRSSLSLFIVSVAAGHFYLRTWWKKLLLSLIVLPVAVFKNGLRIATLAFLGLYVDEGVLSGPLHSKGGIPFFLLALGALAVIVISIRRTEKKAPQ